MVDRAETELGIRQGPDAVLIGAVAALVALGLVMVFSASSTLAVAELHDGAYFFKRQLMWLVIGLIAAYFAYRIEYRRLRAFAPLGLGLSVLMLGLVLVPHIGFQTAGARRWLAAGPFSFQPSEVAKLGLILYLAAALASKGERIRSLVRGVVPVTIVSAVLAVMVLREPDFGTASLFAFTAGALLFAAGARLTHLFMIGVVTVPFAVFVIAHDAYKRNRILAFLNPWQHDKNEGFQIVQSLLALGSGGPFGRGIGFSRQKFFWLPEAHTDFIGAIIGEELGFVGMLAIVVLFVAFAYRAARIALGAPDRFGFFLALGCMAMIVIQAFISIGVVTASWPVTGVPLPFISSGGTSLVVSLVAVALVANVGRHRRAAPLATG
jgi:cell division protein FtsW